MSKEKFIPFGRGSVSDTDDFDVTYDDLYDLSDGEINWENFDPNAQIHESFFTWNRHQHLDNSLGRRVVSTNQLNRTKADADECRLMFSQASNCLVLFGKFVPSGDGIPVGRDPASGKTIELYVDFSSTSMSRQTFHPGTIPLVFCASDRGTSGASIAYPRKYVVVSATSVGFTLGSCAFMSPTEWTNEIHSIFYMAFGRAPGVLSIPDGE